MITVHDLSKVFRIPHAKRKTLYHNLLSLIGGSYTYEEFYALNNVSFSVAPGEFVGIIGRNGSGKSTLLKILSNIYQPTSGDFSVRSEVYPLLELGIGFHPDFTVRDNLYIYGSFLGFTRKEMNDRLDGILEFGDLQRFVDARLDTLSSGMKVRLAFSIAMQAHADVYLVDEVLAVGDTIFQQKCRKVFWQYKEAGKTVLFVSHDVGAVQEYCDRVIVMNAGRLMFDGNPTDAIKYYEGSILQIH